ncbi:MAG TPA: ribosome biogenesis GTPase Der [Bryobacteraceae bacterium]|jgi:GTP-binding protein|nr:ribosome biogenesis GTPase Der [Bryobacteraceae bacterium]
MAEPGSLPVVVIAGRPNVGKSTLFNCIVGQRRSIVGDEPGITRDRIHGEAEHRGRRFELVDTGGIVPDDEALIPSEILKQAGYALERASQIVFLIDGRTEITATDRDLAKMLKRLGKPVTLAVNKIDTSKSDVLVHEFHSLGFADVFPVSAEHRLGMDDLLDHVTAAFPHKGDAEVQSKKKPAVRVAIIGRPNVGKSTLLNALTGEDRAIVSPVAGTTRDAVDERVEKDGSEFVFVDTAGIRRKGKTHLMAEKLSVVMARKHIRSSHVALLIVDASEGVVASDATIAGYAHEEGRALILCVNKWDTRQDKERKEFTQQVRDQFKFLEYAQVAFVSALTGRGVSRLFGMIQKAYDSASYRVTTGELNRFVEMLHFDTDVKVKYITQASIRPPTFVVFADRNLHFSTERFLMNQLRKRFGFEGTPIVIKIRRR